MTLFYTLAAALFLFCARRFFRRARQEARRQRALTWPRATAALSGEPDALKVASVNHFKQPTRYHAELTEPYVFYARGERFTGHRLAPGLKRLTPADAGRFLRQLAEHRRYAVHFDPDDPRDNYLTVGNKLMTYGKQIMYLLFGVALPLALVFLGQTSDMGPTATALFLPILFFVPAIVAGVYFSAKRTGDLGSLLLPAYREPARGSGRDAPDELLQSLARRPVVPVAPPREAAEKERR